MIADRRSYVIGDDDCVDLLHTALEGRDTILPTLDQ